MEPTHSSTNGVRSATGRVVFLAAVLALAATAATAAMTVRSELTAGGRVESAETWEWADLPDAFGGSQLVPGSPIVNQISAKIAEELGKRGLREVKDGEAPDVRVRFFGLTEDRLDSEQLRYRITDRITYESPIGLTARSYQEGTLVIHFIDPETGAVIWRGWATDVAPDQEKLLKKVDKAVEKILKRLPR